MVSPFTSQLCGSSSLFLLTLTVLRAVASAHNAEDKKEGSNEMSYAFLNDLKRLEKRIKSLEQPSWDVTKSPKRWLTCSKGLCRCTLETKTVSCWRRNLESIPMNQIIPYDTNVLDLSINAISALNKNIFNDLQRLTELDISDNRLDYLPEPIFQSLGSLQHLKLRNNMIEQLHKNVLRKQGHLENLDLSFNRLKWLDPQLLSGTPKLVALNLASNALTVLHEDLLQGLDLLEELDLSANRLRTLPELALTGLRAIDLAGNSLASLPSGLLKKTLKLEQFAASRNYLTYVKPNLFRYLPRLAFVDLTSNRISEIVDLQYPPNLRELHLGQNKIRVLPTLQNLKHLERLYLFANDLSELNNGVFLGTPALKTVFLNDNNIHLIEAEVFHPLQDLQYLQLGGNKLIHMAAPVFSHNRNLTAVKLTKNPWHCDCALWDFAKWLKDNKDKTWDMEPTCLGPGEVGGRRIDEMTKEELCEGADGISQATPAQQLSQKSSLT